MRVVSSHVDPRAGCTRTWRAVRVVSSHVVLVQAVGTHGVPLRPGVLARGAHACGALLRGAFPRCVSASRLLRWTGSLRARCLSAAARPGRRLTGGCRRMAGGGRRMTGYPHVRVAGCGLRLRVVGDGLRMTVAGAESSVPGPASDGRGLVPRTRRPVPGDRCGSVRVGAPGARQPVPEARRFAGAPGAARAAGISGRRPAATPPTRRPRCAAAAAVPRPGRRAPAESPRADDVRRGPRREPASRRGSA